MVIRFSVLAVPFFAFAACAIPAPEAHAPALLWPEAVREFASSGQVMDVAAQFPNSSGMQRRRLGAAFEAGDAATVLDALRRLAAMGAVLSPASRAQLAGLVGEEAMAALTAQFEANSAPVAVSSVHAVIPAEHRLVEGLIWDSTDRRLYATTVVDRNLLAIGPENVSVAASEGLGSLFGGAYDPVRKRIWVASASVEQTPKSNPPFAGLVSIAPGDPKDIRRIPAPEGVEATPGDVAVARDGIVYASDGLNGALYRCLPGCEALETYLAPGTLFSSQGLALSPDQRLLYIADRRYGIAALERATGRLLHLTGEDGMMLDGFDGLAAHGDSLIGIQTAYAPARIVRMRLSPDGLRVVGIEVLERANPEWEEVTLGAVAGDRFLYVADAQWERYGEGGAVKGDGPPAPTRIRAIPLGQQTLPPSR